jgi:hypothetical protein
MDEPTIDGSTWVDKLPFNDQVDYYTGQLVISIGAGKFRDEVSELIQRCKLEAYWRGYETAKKEFKK